MKTFKTKKKILPDVVGPILPDIVPSSGPILPDVVPSGPIGPITSEAEKEEEKQDEVKEELVEATETFMTQNEDWKIMEKPKMSLQVISDADDSDEMFTTPFFEKKKFSKKKKKF